MENNIKITFWLNKTKKNSKNLIPIYVRVQLNYDKFFKSTGIYIQAAEWDKKAMRIRGTSQETQANNASLDALKIKILQVVNQLTVLGKPFNIHTIRKTLEGNNANQITLMRVYDEQLGEMKKLKGKDFAPATIIKYKNTQLRLRQYIKFRFQRRDMYLYELNYQFMSGFESFLKQKFNNSATTCYKHYQRFTRVIHQAMHKGYIEKYPFENYKIKLPKKKIQYLTQAELDRIDQCDFKVERLNIIRDKNIPDDVQAFHLEITLVNSVEFCLGEVLNFLLRQFYLVVLKRVFLQITLVHGLMDDTGKSLVMLVAGCC